MTKQIIDLTIKISKAFNFELAVMLSFIEVETGGQGFDSKTGKIIIQFEPSWYKKKAPYAPSGLWSLNKVDVQAKEWPAFTNAFKLNENAAMESTSIGLPQIMGFHYKRLGFNSVGEMWDHAKESLENQIWQLAKFIDTDKNLKKAILNKDWFTIAKIYNGAGFLELARKYKREPYNISMEKAYKKYSV
ncbi:MAG: N-acetylmuramidase domain-containing protein [Chryseobacterium sp.]